MGATPTIENLLRFITGRADVSIELFVEAYEIISEYENWMPVVVVPNQPQLLSKLVWPLRSAKASFMLGNHLGTIALCGMIAEMVAVLRWELDEFQSDANKWPSVSEFERYRQARRTSLLRQRKLVDPAEGQWFDMIRETRNKYLHVFSKDDGDPATDALICFRQACGLVSWIVGNRYQEMPTPRINQALMEWLDRKGLLFDSLTDEDIERMKNEGKL